MAIYHLHASIIQRSQGKNVIAASAYRRAAKLRDDQQARHWNYTHKPNVVHSEISAPEDAPAWVTELVQCHQDNPSHAAEQLWNRVTAAEKRVDAQLAREIEFALPLELTPDQSIALARDFIRDQFVLRGMIADWSVHGETGNPHVHVLLTMRKATESGLGPRELAWNSKGLLQTWREQWAEYANFHLHAHQHSVKIDHRSYADQGIDLIPGIHEGSAAQAMAHRGIVGDRIEQAQSIRGLNLTKISQNPGILFRHLSAGSDTFTAQSMIQTLWGYLRGHRDLGNISPSPPTVFRHDPETLPSVEAILQSITQHDSVFSEKSIARAVARLTPHADAFAQAVIAIQRSPEVVALGAGDDGRDRFTTRAWIQCENDLQTCADALRQRVHIKLPASSRQMILDHYQHQVGKTLTDEQKMAVDYLLRPVAMACVVGRAGTGKSFGLGAAKAVWEAHGLTVHGIALSGIAADGLQKDAGIKSHTIASFVYRLENQHLTLTDRSVVVMDEAGMTDSLSMKRVLEKVVAAQAKLVLVGDPAQLQPVGPGAPFRALVERLGFAEIQTVYRQSQPWQRQATVDFSQGETEKGLAAYQSQGCFHVKATPDAAMAALLADWQRVAQSDIRQVLVVAHRNEEVVALNTLIRNHRVKTGDLAQGNGVQTHAGKMPMACGDRILFLRNDRDLGVSNGRFATVVSIDGISAGEVTRFTAKCDGSDTIVTIHPPDYADFTYGYAATVHKTQGMTVDHSLVYVAGAGWHRHLTYVSFTRHRQSCHLYTDRQTYSDTTVLTRQLCRYGQKDSVLDFPLAFAQRRGIDPAAESIHQRREDARVVAAYVDARRDVGIAWGALKTKLTALGLPAMTYAQPDFTLIQGTPEYQTFQSASQVADARADVIAQQPERYTQALAIYDLDAAQWTKAAQRQACYRRVTDYVHRCQTGAVVWRDRQAADIWRDSRAHYAARQRCGLHTAESYFALRSHALAHLRRQCFLTLTPAEKAAFYGVEAYQAAARRVGVQWHALDASKEPTPTALAHYEATVHQRDACAAAVLASLDTSQKALDFYQIGKGIAHWGESLNADHHRKAQARWYRLQQHAARHASRDRVQCYHRAFTQGDVTTRLSVANAILQDTPAHHGAVVGLGEDTPALWRSIRQDAAQYAQVQYYRQLDLVDRLGFHAAKRYVDAKKAHAQAWHDLFTRKENAIAAQKDPQAVIPLDDYATAKTYTQTRNALAAALLAHPPLHQVGIDYFKLTPDELHTAAYAHQCRLNVEAYTRATSPWVRAECALRLTHDPKAHHPALLEQGGTWKNVYRDARPAQRRQDFATLTPEEKSFYRNVERYRHANQQVGQWFAKHGKNPLKGSLAAPLAHRLARRDHYAWRVVNHARQNDPHHWREAVTAQRLHPDKLIRQHALQTERLATVIAYQRQYDTTLASVRPICGTAATHPPSAADLKKALIQVNRLLYWHTSHRCHPPEYWRYAWLTLGLSPEAVAQHPVAWLTIKQTLQGLASRQSLVIPPVALASTHAVETTPRRYPPRVDCHALRAALNDRAEAVAIHYLGQPKTRHGHTWRYGRHQGSLVVQVSGPRQGLWHDFQLGKGGDMLSLIQHTGELSDFKAVLQEATRFLGGSSAFVGDTPRQSPPVKSIGIDAHTQQRIAKAQAIARQTQPIAGTLAERYCREHRGIAGKMDETHVRYHPRLSNWMTRSNHPALVILARDAKQQVCGVQAIFLDANTANKASDLGHHVKLSRGLMGEGSIIQHGKHGGTIALAEGPETALSIAQAKPDWTVIVAFGVGNFKSVRLPEWGKTLIICADNDDTQAHTHKSVTQAVQQWTQRGIAVSVIEPQKPAHQKKWDFNDVLRTQGVEAVRSELDRIGLQQSNGILDSQRHAFPLPLSPLDTHHHATTIDDRTLIEKLTVELKNESLETLLGRYVDMELEQSRLLSEMYSARLQDPTTYHPFAERMITHHKALDAFAHQVAEHPEMKMCEETQRHDKPRKLADCGGFIGIHERVQSGSWSTEDVQTVIEQVRQKAARASPVQMRERDRGGRGR